MPEQTLYIFIDESGDFNFSSKGSDYFFLTAISTIQPDRERNALKTLKYDFLKSGQDIEYFHAAEDKQTVRDAVFSILNKLVDFEVDTVIAEKRKANRALYESTTLRQKTDGHWKFRTESVEEKFYKQMCQTLLKYLVTRYLEHKADVNIKKIVVVMAQVLTGKKREFIIKNIKTFVKEVFGVVPYVYFHAMKADVNCQIADYCSWAIAIKWTRGERRPYDLIRDKIRNEFPIFRKGRLNYYKK